jgi:hypothetical protein
MKNTFSSEHTVMHKRNITSLGVSEFFIEYLLNVINQVVFFQRGIELSHKHIIKESRITNLRTKARIFCANRGNFYQGNKFMQNKPLLNV